ncbi:mannose-6-phosphate isomerase-like protein (cupin superfamily) [Caldicoprobacter guelmensis]|uniref:cupin domain-containing protein n=1 Tax=Caldicoprobacter guelmensis TaxID=1170224 RepID=UPI00195B684E|nr:cupin domain-containing protein [Caldicoprobacter guelmensis]MBM7582797.1 mannose-6-phosphate isomerase-like protein (cupin superfamily) [Caldicoprobacter guelmensis]
MCSHRYYPYPPCYNDRPIYPNYDYYFWMDRSAYTPDFGEEYIPLKDYGSEPFVVNIQHATLQNDNFRLALWTGKYLQLTLMKINPGEDIGLEMHPDVDQFIRIEQGQGLVLMGDDRNNLNYRRRVCAGYAVLIPAGKWHNVINTGHIPLKLYSIYAPPEHPRGTVHKTKEDAQHHE